MFFTPMSDRARVLSLYRQILRLSKTWVAKTSDPIQTHQERNYIRHEAQAQFRKNKELTDPKVISDRIQEGEARMEIALHYRIPYPRPVNLPPLSMARRLGKEQGKVQERIKKQSIPIYIKSET